MDMILIILGGVIPALFFIVPLFLMARSLRSMNEGMADHRRTSRKIDPPRRRLRGCEKIPKTIMDGEGVRGLVSGGQQTLSRIVLRY